MCLGIPGQVTLIFEQNSARMGKLNFGGIIKDVCLEYLPEIQIGDYAIVHVGFAITQVDEASAQETLRLFREMGALEAELKPEEHVEVERVAPTECAVDPWGGAASALTPSLSQRETEQNP